MKIYISKYLFWIILRLFSISFLITLSNSAIGQEITLKVDGIPDVSGSTIDSKIARAVLDEFHKKYPEIKIVSTSGLMIESKGSNLLIQIASNNAPDVLYVNFSSSQTLIDQEFLYPLDEFVKESDSASQKMVPEKLWPIIKRKGPDGVENIFAWPTQPVVRALFYRKDLFQEAGLPDRVPYNWEELITFARKLTNPEKGQYGLALYGGPSVGW